MIALTRSRQVRKPRAPVHWLQFATMVLAFVAAFSGTALAQPGIIPIGSSLTYGGTNAPDTYSAVTTFSSTPVLVDNGAVKIWQQQTPTGANGEWDVFYMQTTSGGPLAGDISGNWNIVISYDLSAPVYFDGVVQQWLVNGTPVSPLTNGIGSICCATASNPILPGDAYYSSGFNTALPAGVETNWQQIFVNPYTYISSGGVNPNTANEFFFALHFTLQAAAAPFTTALAAGFQVEPFAPEAIVAAFGTNLSTGTAAATTLPLPTVLDGTTVTVTDSAGVVRPAPLFYVSSGQVNFEIPAGTATGAATVTITPQSTVTQTESIQIGSVSPGLFTLNASGLVAAWVLPVESGVQQALQAVYQMSGSSLIASPVSLGPSTEQVYLVLYGTGIRNATTVTASVGSLSVPVLFAGAAPDEVGEDQVNIGPRPRSLAGQGSVDIVLTADGQVANTVNVTIP